jgi:alcohol dehydrogenase (cytochrome c)
VLAQAGGAAATASSDWLSYNGSYANDRFSPLGEITAANVARLRRVCTFTTNDSVSFQASPVVVNGVIYVSTYNTTYAVDGNSCVERWHNTRPAPRPFLPVNRGVGYADGRIFRGTSDAHLLALDTAGGRTLWDIALGDAAKGESIPMAPVSWHGMLFVGTAGGDNFDVRARVYAIDPATGRELWHFETVADSGASAATWLKRSAQNPPAGGGMWTSLSIDTARGILYVPTGNAAPDFAEQLHPGDNLYTTGILALEASTGRLLGFIQPIKHDFHDWDIAAAPALITTRAGRSMIAAPGKDGLLYGIDRSGINRNAALADGASQRRGARSGVYGAAGPDGMVVRFRTATTTRTNTTVRFSSTAETRFCPGSQGGTEWGGPAWNASLNLVFVNAVDWCTSVRLARLDTLRGKPGAPWTGDYQGGFGRQDPKERWQGWLTAIDGDNGKVVWKYRASAPLLAPVTATAGGIVLTGEVLGDIVALDARTGKVLWRDNTGQAIGGGITAYAVSGHERIAVPAGLNSPIWPVNGGPARVYVYGLP